jgi:hypothetical protein
MQIVYSYKDLVRLIKADLVTKRIELLTTPADMATLGKSAISCEVEFIEQALPQLPAPVPEQAEVINDEPPTLPQPKTAKKTKGVSRIGKTPEQLEKDRAYKERWKAKQAGKSTDQANAQAPIAQATAKQPYQRITPEERQAVVEQRTRDYANERGHTVWEPDFGEKVLAEIEELKKAEVVAASPGPFQS